MVGLAITRYEYFKFIDIFFKASYMIFLNRLFILFLFTAFPIFFFVTKKKIGNAVKRNKIKRRLRNIINDATKEITLKFNYSYLVIAKPTMLNNEYTNIKETLFQSFKKIK